MKKMLVCLLTISLLAVLTGCGKTTPEETTAAETEAPETTAPETEAPETTAPETEAPETEAPETEAEAPVGPISGGWTQNTEFADAVIPEDAAEALELALKGYTGAGLEPVALLGTQIVSGLNYKILCKSSTVTAQPVVELVLVTVYKDLQGGAEIQDVKALSECEYLEAAPETGLSGGWTVCTESYAPLPEEAQAAFDKVLEGLTGAAHTPVALLGTQVVAGINYQILATSAPIVPDAQAALTVLTIYQDLQGNAELQSSAYLDLAQ